MKALILVAGNSRRMGELTDNTHKTLLPVNDKPILHWMLTALTANGIRDIVFVDGYNRELLHRYVQEKHRDVRPTWIENTDYDTTNTTASVLLARETFLAEPDRDMLLINGDVVMDSRAIERTLAADGENVLATTFDSVEEEEVKVRLGEDGRIVEIGKHIDPAQAAGESVGINRLGSVLLPDLFEMMETRVRKGEGSREFYEASFNALIQENAPFRTADVTDLPVMEVDTPEDYEEVRREIAPRLRT